jgi:hypothetical protein
MSGMLMALEEMPPWTGYATTVQDEEGAKVVCCARMDGEYPGAYLMAIMYMRDGGYAGHQMLRVFGARDGLLLFLGTTPIHPNDDVWHRPGAPLLGYTRQHFEDAWEQYEGEYELRAEGYVMLIIEDQRLYVLSFDPSDSIEIPFYLDDDEE